MSGDDHSQVYTLHFNQLLVRRDDGKDVLIDGVLEAGAVVAVVGSSGGFPTSVLRTLVEGRSSTTGQVLLNGSPLHPRDTAILTRQHELVGSLTAAENVLLVALARGRAVDSWSSIEALLDALLVPAPSWHNLLEQLSGGQQQRVAIARTLFAQSAVMCLDDPVSELDSETAAVIWNVVQRATSSSAITLVTTHTLKSVPIATHVLTEKGLRTLQHDRTNRH